MQVKKDWEVKIEKERKNLWLVTTNLGKFICKKFRGNFFVKDCADQLPVEGKVLSSEQL